MPTSSQNTTSLFPPTYNSSLSVTPEASTPLRSGATSPGEISPPSTPDPNPAERLRNAQRSLIEAAGRARCVLAEDFTEDEACDLGEPIHVRNISSQETEVGEHYYVQSEEKEWGGAHHGEGEEPELTRYTFGGIARAPPPQDSDSDSDRSPTDIRGPYESTSPVFPKTPNNTETTSTESGSPTTPTVGKRDEVWQELSRREQMAHEHLLSALHNRRVSLPPQLPVPFISGPVAPSPAIKLTRSASAVEHPKRPNTDPDEGHKGKVPRRSVIEEGQGGDMGEQARILRPILSGELMPLLHSRDKAIEELKTVVEALGRRLEELGALPEKKGGGEEKDGEKGEKISTVNTVLLPPGKEGGGELQAWVRWGLWGGVLVAVATLGGLVGAAVERGGGVGRGVTEWIWV